MVYSPVAVVTTTTNIVPRNVKRVSLFLENNSTQTVYIVKGGVTNNIPPLSNSTYDWILRPGGTIEIFSTAPVFGRVLSGTAYIGVFELEKRS